MSYSNSNQSTLTSSSLYSLDLYSSMDMEYFLRKNLHNFHKISWVNSTSSTNNNLLKLARYTRSYLIKKPWIIGAYHQTEGRGRNGRSWINIFGSTLMFSCAFDINVSSNEIPSISPFLGLITCKTLRDFLGKIQKNFF
ncbi:MAG: hypothetical protein IR526_02975 [Bordetella sp.]|nr:MAG: hypothetical protein IR526_02975 [Bordetella sp.]